MASPVLLVRVAATIEELKRNLAEGVSQIETTTATMGKLAASFSGDKLIQAAQNVTAAVNAIGGASKLTDAEAARVNATLEKALEKYAALGRVAPAGMRELADETKRADTTSSGLTDTVKQLAMGFAAMFTARAAFNFVKDTIAEASALKDLSQQTHMSVEELQILAGGMSEFGVDADTLGKGLFKLSRGIAGGDESVATGLHLMGMSLKDVEGLQGKELFLKIESGLAKLQGGLRDTAAADLFGGKLGSAMAGASEGIGGAIEKWQQLNTVASTESVDAMDTFGESIERAQKNMSSFAANLIGPVAQGFNFLFDAADKGATKYQLFAAMAQDLIEHNLHLGTGTEHLTALLNGQNVAQEAAAAAAKKAAGGHKEVAVAVDTRTQAEKFLAALEADAGEALTTVQVANLEHLKEIGALNAKNAAAIGVNAVQFAAYTASVTEATKATAALKTIQDAAAKVEEAYGTKTTTIWETVFEDRNALYATDAQRQKNHALAGYAIAVKEAQDRGVVSVEYYDALWARYQTDLDKQTAQRLQSDLYSQDHYEQLKDKAQDAYDFALAHADRYTKEEIRMRAEALRKATENSNNWRDTALADMAAVAGAAPGTAAAIDEIAAAHDREAQAAQKACDANEKLNKSLTHINTYNAMNFDQMLQAETGHYIEGANYGTSATFGGGGNAGSRLMLKGSTPISATEAAERGYGFQEIVAAIKGGALAVKPMGPRIPGFAGGVEDFGGGLALVGERGPEMMYVPPHASIYPSGSGAGSSGPTIVQHIYVNTPLGTPAQIAAHIDAATTKSLRDHGVRF